MLGLALEGGGARGAFHIGAVSAFLEHGYEFTSVVGTSIGAFNAALISQGDFEKAYDFWANMEPSDLFNIEDEAMINVSNKEITKDTIVYLSKKAKELIDNKGTNSTKLMKVLDENIDENRLRKSKIDFGMVTVSIPEFKALEVYKEDIPKGMINEYILASSNFPGFKLHPIDGKYYIDGGIHDNCPVNLLIKKGYKDIIAIRTSKKDKLQRLESKDANIINIIPSEDLGEIVIFNNELIRKNIKLGYYDSKRYIQGLVGKKYYIKPFKEESFINIIKNIPEDTILKIAKAMKIPYINSKRLLFEKIIPKISHQLKLPNNASYQEIFVNLLEVIAIERKVKKYNIYTIDTFIEEIEKTHTLKDRESRKLINLLNLEKINTGLLGTDSLNEVANVILDTLSTYKFDE